MIETHTEELSMGVGGFAIFGLGLICGVGVALYFARASEGSADARSRPPSEQQGDTSESSPSTADESSVGVEELMGRPDEESGVTETADGGTDETVSTDMAGGDSVGARTDESSHWLEGISGSVAGKRYLIEEATVVGRLPRNDLQLNEGDVSRVHCRFRLDGERVVVETLDTPNGTRLNYREIGPGEPVTLEDEDVIEVGKVLLMYHHKPSGAMPEGLGEESSDVGFSMGADVGTVTVDTNDWRDRIAGELEAAGGDVSVAAQALGMDSDALERLADQLEID